MLKQSIAAEFESADICGCSDAKPILNYVWINAQKSVENAQVLCSVPLTQLDIAYKNARRYPNLDVAIWFDYALMSTSDKNVVERHNVLNAPDNVSLKSLHDIPSYNDHAIFDLAKRGAIWSRVDLARLLVLEHCLKTKTSNFVTYSDFDVPDVVLGAASKIWKTLNVYGFAAGGHAETVSNRHQSGTIENSFIAFKRGAMSHLLSSKLIPNTLECIKNDANGYSGFKRFVKSCFWSEEFSFSMMPDDGVCRAPSFVHRVVLPMGVETAQDEQYVSSGVNESTALFYESVS